MKLAELNDLLTAVCPIIGLNSDGVIWFEPEATDDQKAQATILMQQHISEILP